MNCGPKISYLSAPSKRFVCSECMLIQKHNFYKNSTIVLLILKLEENTCLTHPIVLIIPNKYLLKGYLNKYTN